MQLKRPVKKNKERICKSKTKHDGYVMQICLKQKLSVIQTAHDRGWRHDKWAVCGSFMVMVGRSKRVEAYVEGVVCVRFTNV